MQQLFSGTTLQGGKYKIVRFLSSGGFGCTYEGEHVMLHKRIAIKEFFVKAFCNRDEKTSHVTVGTQSKVALVEKLRNKFIDEAVALSQLTHPNIVSVYDVFMENGTAYYVMDFIDGKSLHQIINERGALPENEALSYIKDVAEALKYVHSLNRLHLDIKPGNIMVTSDGCAKLIDFGASKQYDEVDGENTSTLLGMTPGYAPIEQMGNRVQTFCAPTDIYALGATFYKIITGETPADATKIAEDEDALKPIPENISVKVRNTIMKSLEVRRKDRQQNMDEFLSMLCQPAIKSNILVSTLEMPIDEENTLTHICEEYSLSKDKFSSVDLGLSVKWAECNVAAKHSWDAGCLVGWGDGLGNKKSLDLEDYPSKTPPQCITNTVFDIATQSMGEGWRIPTQNEMLELIEKCNWQLIIENGINGYNVIGPSGKSIFLPAAGYRNGDNRKFMNEKGYYWTSDLANSASAYALSFKENEYKVTSHVRYYGRCIRPVKDK